MIPPKWIRDTGIRLGLEEFQSQFAAAWSQLRTRFLKVECWQEYQELEATESQKAYRDGGISAARELLEQEAQGDRPLYDDIQRRQLDYARVRLLKLPLTDYLKYEMTAYSIRASVGENIEVVQLPSSAAVPSEKNFDFLLFDRHTALVHDYGAADAGAQTGGWISHDAQIISTLEEQALALRARAVPLKEFMAATRILRVWMVLA